MTLGRWTDPVDLGPFRFRPFGARGGMCHRPGGRHRIAFLRPGARLPEGYVWGPPPPMDAETWARWAKAEHRRLREERE